EQRRLASVGVTDDGHQRIGHAPPPGAMQLTGAHHDIQLLPDGVDALLDEAPVRLDLSLTRTAEEAVATALALQVGPAPDQPALLISEVSQLDLEPTFPRPGPAPEDLQDKAGAIEHLRVPGSLQVALLDGRDGVIDYDEVRFMPGDKLFQLLDLA